MSRIEYRLHRARRAFDARLRQVLPSQTIAQISRHHARFNEIRAYLGEPMLPLRDSLDHARLSDEADACEMLATGCSRLDAFMKRLCQTMNERGAHTTIECVRALCDAYGELMRRIEADMKAGIPASASAAVAEYKAVSKSRCRHED